MGCKWGGHFGVVCELRRLADNDVGPHGALLLISEGGAEVLLLGYVHSDEVGNERGKSEGKAARLWWLTAIA